MFVSTMERLITYLRYYGKGVGFRDLSNTAPKIVYAFLYVQQKRPLPKMGKSAAGVTGERRTGCRDQEHLPP